MAEDASALMRGVGIERARVYGISMGGMIAQELALNHPLRVRSLILGCTACGGRQSVPASKAVAAALGARSTMTREEAAWAMAPYIFDAGTPRELVEEDIAVRLTARVTNDGYFAQLQGIRAWGGTYDRLAGIAMPTLVIHGETDQLVPAENGRIIAGALPRARLVMIPNASHIFFTDQLEASSEALLAFLEAPAPA
jgi:pimeloyl-ACP methyl ester carboxylesterase